MGGTDRVAHVRHGDRRGDGDAFIARPHAGRRLRSRRSKRRAGSKVKSASFAFCTLLVAVTGSSSTKATIPGALKYASLSRHHSWMEIAFSLLLSDDTTQAMTSSSRTGSGAAITATCWIA